MFASRVKLPGRYGAALWLDIIIATMRLPPAALVIEALLRSLKSMQSTTSNAVAGASH